MHRVSNAGFSLWELILVVVLVVLLFLAAIDTLLRVKAAAERAHVEYTVGNLRSALGMQATRRVLDPGSGGLASLAGENPLDWLAIPPPTSKAGMEEMRAGSWSWQPAGKLLVYRLKYPQYVEGAHGGEWLRFQVRFRGDARSPTRISLDGLDGYRWLTPGSMEKVVENGVLDQPSE